MRFLNKIFAKIETNIYKSNFVGESFGVKISDMRNKNDRYKDIIISSLKLIKKHDPKRFKRVTNNISWVINSANTVKYDGKYNALTKGCFINFENYDNNQELVSAFYAGIIIKEATSGFIYSKGIKFTEKTRIQRLRICYSEMNRFYKIIEKNLKQYEGLLIQEYDEQAWERTRKPSKWKAFYYTIIRIKRD